MRTRVNPRVNRDLPQQPPVQDPRYDAARERDPESTLRLVDVTTSAGWEEFVVQNLTRRCRSIERRLATSPGIAPNEIIRLQAQHELMEQMTADPKAFFRADPYGSD